MRKIALLVAILAMVSLAVVAPPTNCLLKFETNYPQLANIQSAFNTLGWPHVDHIGQTYPAFWTALNDGTDWNIVAMDCTYYAVSGDFNALTAYGTAHPNCRILFFSWAAYNLGSTFYNWFDVSAISDIFGTSMPPAFIWDSASPIWTYAGLSTPPAWSISGLNRVGHRLTWIAAKATSDVPLGYAATSTQGQGAWVFARKPGTETWQRPRSVWLGFPQSMNSSNGATYYKGILQYMWEEEDPGPGKVTPTSLGNIKASYR